MFKILVLLALMVPSSAFAQHLKCDGKDYGYEWSYDITLEGDFGRLLYEFNDIRQEYNLEVEPRGFLVPSPFEFDQQMFLVRAQHGWDVELWNYDGTRNGYIIDEFFCIEQ